MERINEIKLISDIFSNLSIIIAAIIACTTFKFKLGVDERKLYLDNVNKVRDVLSFVFKEGKIDNANLIKIRNAFDDALLYLNKDVCIYVEEILNLLYTLETLQIELTDRNILEDDIRKKYIKQQYEIKLKLNEKGKEIFQVYRKHLVSELIESFKSVISKDKALPFLKEKKHAD